MSNTTTGTVKWFNDEKASALSLKNQVQMFLHTSCYC